MENHSHQCTHQVQAEVLGLCAWSRLKANEGAALRGIRAHPKHYQSEFPILDY